MKTLREAMAEAIGDAWDHGAVLGESPLNRDETEARLLARVMNVWASRETPEGWTIVKDATGTKSTAAAIALSNRLGLREIHKLLAADACYISPCGHTVHFQYGGAKTVKTYQDKIL